MAFSDRIAHIEEVLGYHFACPALLEQAFRRPDYCNELRQAGGPDLPSYQVLEFIGDSILGAAIVTLLCEDGGEIGAGGFCSPLHEGNFTTVKSNLSDKTAFSRIISRTDLADCLLLGKGGHTDGVAAGPSAREDLFEAIFGALWLDCHDFARVTAVLSRFLDRDTLRGFLSNPPRTPSAKNAVQEWCDSPENKARGATLAVPYPVLAESGPDHDKHYTVACRITFADGRVLQTQGEGRSKKEAELAAAAEMCELLEKE